MKELGHQPNSSTAYGTDTTMGGKLSIEEVGKVRLTDQLQQPNSIVTMVSYNDPGQPLVSYITTLTSHITTLISYITTLISYNLPHVTCGIVSQRQSTKVGFAWLCTSCVWLFFVQHNENNKSVQFLLTPPL